MNIKFYKVNDNYVTYLHSFDEKVQLHHDDGKPKPYIGVIMPVHAHHYFVPLSSPKPKHSTRRENLTFLKVVDSGDLLAVININNMIPVPDSEFELYNFAEHSPKHQDLLNKEYNEVKRISNKLSKNAKTLYSLVTKYPKDNTNYVKLCCNFTLLEQKCEEYSYEKIMG